MNLCRTGFAIVVMLAGCATLQAAIYNWNDLTFESPLELSQPASIGMDAVSLLFPAESTVSQWKLEITLALAAKDMIEAAGFKTDAEILGYLKTTFLGASDQSMTETERTIMGKKLKGSKQAVTIPRNLHLETYLIELTNGNRFMMAFRWDDTMDSSQLESIISKITETIKEQPAPSK